MLCFCDPYAVEGYQVEKTLRSTGVTLLKIETDYSTQDLG